MAFCPLNQEKFGSLESGHYCILRYCFSRPILSMKQRRTFPSAFPCPSLQAHLLKSLLISNWNSVQPMKIQLPMQFSEVSDSFGVSQGAEVWSKLVLRVLNSRSSTEIYIIDQLRRMERCFVRLNIWSLPFPNIQHEFKLGFARPSVPSV